MRNYFEKQGDILYLHIYFLPTCLVYTVRFKWSTNIQHTQDVVCDPVFFKVRIVFIVSLGNFCIRAIKFDVDGGDCAFLPSCFIK